ncbi:adenylyltransferase/cytidyltransferase family protein [Halanaerobium sp. Z-7514]|uniref:Adenylyltransferase/cytidyltransferase family protein n=1 Tax=Halanaerobium polyolivorans TaxID=2886943 RepID=A0AAW4X1H4_9FIRM|nr:adenylyltransferase/cytidyltransferase family protein [Halanaerobium polyolivorans]
MISKISYSFVIADLLHYGHVRLLKKAKEEADYHICGLISDEACHKWQGVNVSNYEERKKVLESLDCIDEVIKQDTMDPTSNLKLIHNNFPKAELIIVHGDDWRAIPGKEYVEKIGGRVVQPEYYSRLSRDKIIDKFRDDSYIEGFDHEYYNEHFVIGKIDHFKENGDNNLISTKANTLKNFKYILENSYIEPMYVFNVDEYNNNKEKILKEINNKFNNKIVVRSSSFQEDNMTESKAGYFESVIDVDSNNQDKINNAVNRVIDSFKHEDNGNDQILVQRQTDKIKKSGVIFTRNIKDNTPYYYINYDDESSRTDSVTDGSVGKAVWFYRDLELCEYPDEWKSVIKAVKEIEEKIPNMVLDIEFAEKNDGTIVIFQIRPLAANVKFKKDINDEKFTDLLEKNINKYNSCNYNLYDNNRILSDMAFWNPAEIIGDNPAKLDYSLYNYIITSRSWNDGLTPLGYSKLSEEIMERYGNKPYINVDYSFYALTPENINEQIKEKLMDYYIEQLMDDFTCHDKIEFEISFNCFNCSTKKDLQPLESEGFNKEEIKEIEGSLREITINSIKDYRNILEKDLNSLDILNEKVEGIKKEIENLDDPIKVINKAVTILDYINEYGTPEFSKMARLAFISNSLCKSFVSEGYFSQDEIDKFMNSINTVASDFERDFNLLAAGSLNEDEFKEKYGHLRAGTYDIRTRTYNEMSFKEVSSNAVTIESLETKDADLDDSKIKEILSDLKFDNISVEDFKFFLKSSIKQREYFKFEFTKALSYVIELFAKAGNHLGFSREEMSYLDIPAIKSAKFYSDLNDVKEFWSTIIKSNKEKHKFNSKMILPPVLSSEKDFKIINSWISRPNFITEKKALGEVINLEEIDETDIDNKIVMISKADPGYDWIFTKDIKGLITRYGGAASHMAIRAAEFDIPAAIGCGERLFNMINEWDRIKLDCCAKKITNIGGSHEESLDISKSTG